MTREISNTPKSTRYVFELTFEIFIKVTFVFLFSVGGAIELFSCVAGTPGVRELVPIMIELIFDEASVDESSLDIENDLDLPDGAEPGVFGCVIAVLESTMAITAFSDHRIMSFDTAGTFRASDGPVPVDGFIVRYGDVFARIYLHNQHVYVRADRYVTRSSACSSPYNRIRERYDL